MTKKELSDNYILIVVYPRIGPPKMRDIAVLLFILLLFIPQITFCINMFQMLIKQAQCDWLDHDENADRWCGNEGSFTASERRVLITHWVGDAYNLLISEKYADFIRKMWERTGCLITADGSEDHLIAPEGLPGYVVHPPLPIDATNGAPTSNAVEGTPAADEVEEEDDLEQVLASERVDRIEDQSKDMPLVGGKLRGVYGNGVFTGNIRYFNTALKEYNVLYEDGTDDYFVEEDIDGVELILI